MAATRSLDSLLFSKNAHTIHTINHAAPSVFAAVDHSREYKNAMEGGHGRQIALAEMEGIGKDDPDFDPFLEEEREEAHRKRAYMSKTTEEAPYIDTEITSNEDMDEQVDDDDWSRDDGDDDDDQDYGIYNNDGSLRRTKAELATLRAGAPAGGVFAIIELAGSQHKVTTDDVLIVNRLKPVELFKVGSTHTLTDVLLLSSSSLTLVGMPFVSGAEVDVMVEEITKDTKVVIFQKRRRKNSDRRNGFRRDVTMLRIVDIRCPVPYQEHIHEERLSSQVNDKM
jgi:large subunit ribosomal protein L21